jgi:hypothetical protein
MKKFRTMFIIIFSILLIAPVTLSFQAKQPNAIAAANPANSASLSSRIVCASGSHNTCQPGPFTETYHISEPTWVVVDIYLVHTGNYEPNETSHFTSPFGEILDCGPLQPGEDEKYCGQVVGFVEDSIDFTIEHAGDGSDTGSHKQRYDIKLCHEEVFFPAIFNGVP